MTSFTIAVNDNEFNHLVQQSQIPVIVDFWAPACSPCIAIGQTLDALAAEYSGKFIVAKMNVDENVNIPSEFGVRGLPYLIVFVRGKAVETLAGNVSKSKLQDLIKRTIFATSNF